MKIAITSQGPTLDYELDPRFGRCKYFLFVDSETLEFSAKENPYIDASGGAGPQAGQLVINEKPDIIITGSLGPKAETALAASGIKYITGVEGVIKDIIEKHKN